MSFSDLLKKPLPSKLAEEEEVTTESADDVATEVDELLYVTEGTESDKISAEVDAEINKLAEVKTEDSDEDDNVEDVEDDKDDDNDDPTEDVEDLEDLDLSGLTDEELDQMEEELRDSDLDDVIGDDDEPVVLTAEEEREADDLMSLAGTTELLKSELNAEERASFLESATETQIAVFEGFLLESDVVPATDDVDDEVMTEAKLYNKTTIRFSREDRKAQLYAVALNVSARAHNDPDFIKLQKVQKIRRVLKRKIRRKYHAEAMRRMKVYFNRLRSSKSTVLSALGKKIAGSDKKDN